MPQKCVDSSVAYYGGGVYFSSGSGGDDCRYGGGDVSGVRDI